MATNKVFADCDSAVADIFDGAVIMIGGFGSWGGLPINLIVALAKQGARNLTVISNQGGVGFELSKRIKPGGYQDIGALYEKGQVKKFIGSVPALGGMPPTSPIETAHREGRWKSRWFRREPWRKEFEPEPAAGRILHNHGRRHSCGSRQRKEGNQRQGIPAGAAADGGFRPHQSA
jgi:hypothetical protein